MVYLYVTGGLGNQLRIFFTGYTVACYLHEELTLDLSSYYSGYFRHFRLDSLVLPVYKTCGKRLSNPLEIDINHYQSITDKQICVDECLTREQLIYKCEGYKDVFLYGYGGTRFCTKEELNYLRNTITPCKWNKESMKFRNDLLTGNTVSVHVRRTDFISEGWFDVQAIDYIKAAIMYIFLYVDSPEFYFFSDDMEWVKQTFLKRANYHYVELAQYETRDVDELFCLAACKHHILANHSTYSAFGSFFSKDWDCINIASSIEELEAAQQLTILDREIICLLSKEYESRIG